MLANKQRHVHTTENLQNKSGYLQSQLSKLQKCYT